MVAFSSRQLLVAFGAALTIFTVVLTVDGLQCHCSRAHCDGSRSCNSTNPLTSLPGEFCIVYKHIHTRENGSTFLTLDQKCWMPTNGYIVYFLCLQHGTCASRWNEDCFCCTTPNCNTPEFYDEQRAKRNVTLPGNSSTTVNPDATNSTNVQVDHLSPDVVVIIILCVAILVIGACIVTIVGVHISVRVGSKRAHSGSSSALSEDSQSPGLFDYSGSGAGLPLLAQRSIALDIKLFRQIGRGRYGEVWHGNYKSEDVAVKIFEGHEETSWEKETAIYITNLISHPNILRFIGADNKDVHFCTKRWLVFEYCEYKALYEYLQAHTLTESMFCSMALGIVSGIHHLHDDVHGKVYKPSIAHRDIKSGNILVRGDLTCCIADFGLALSSASHKDVLKDPSLAVAGTKRYLAPELLDGSFNVKSFQSFLQADMYSLSLVLWEMARRVLSEEKALEYQVPYQDCTPRDPSLEDMKEVVCRQGRRPQIPNTWDGSVPLSTVGQVLEGCWAPNSSPKARLTALRIVKMLQTINCTQTYNNKTLFQPA
uniref:receptor protein serine/threonine kinase n=1 Tax=Halisarca dujardinii TaxID=2583056 RepID=A0A8F8FKY1_HALDU|nr:TGF-beta receptor type I HduTGFbRIa [Halisarca dujardinii]QZX63226.1 TGF-beta receptor type-1 isoform 2 [Halisarca dujardinii]